MPKYYEVMGLKEDPFKISPDPRYFYPTTNHDDALQRLYLAIENTEGLSVIYGDYGTGKSTMVEIIQNKYRKLDDYIVGMIATAKSGSDMHFYRLVMDALRIDFKGRTTLTARTALEAFVMEKNLVENKTIILIIDEGESLSLPNIDLLRTLLNFGNADRKFIQIVIFGQLELLPKIRKRKNFVDRISLSYMLNPLNQDQMREMIEFRLKVAGLDDGKKLIADGAYEIIYGFTKGFPRQTVNLCNDALKTCVLEGSDMINEEIATRHGEKHKGFYGDRTVRKV